ncbi:MAG: hypothetical protein ACJ72A_15340, partial [Nocardioidaceae bacterium]
ERPVSRRVSAVAAAASMALLPVLLTTGPASADQVRYREATHDVQKLDAASEDFEPITDPTATNGDIEDVFIHYRAGRLVIRANYVDLRPRKDTQMVFTGEIKTNEKRRWLYQVETSPGKYAGHDELRTYRNYRKACEIGHFFDYRENFTRVVVPLYCLSNPRWVKVSVGAATVQLDEEALKEFLESDSDVPPEGGL